MDILQEANTGPVWNCAHIPFRASFTPSPCPTPIWWPLPFFMTHTWWPLPCTAHLRIRRHPVTSLGTCPSWQSPPLPSHPRSDQPLIPDDYTAYVLPKAPSSSLFSPSQPCFCPLPYLVFTIVALLLVSLPSFVALLSISTDSLTVSVKSCFLKKLWILT